MQNVIIEALLGRRSQARLAAPAPAGAALERILACALRAPDHALLRPWRYLLVEGQAREDLGELFARALLCRKSDAEESVVARARTMALRAPLLIVAVCSPQDHPKVPLIEQQMSLAAGVAYLLLGLEAEGFGGVWRTGEFASDPLVMRELGLVAGESIAGFIYAGTPVTPAGDMVRPQVNDHVASWTAGGVQVFTV